MISTFLAVTQSEVLWFSFAILITFFLMIGVFFLGLWIRRNQVGRSPYTGFPLRSGGDLSYDGTEKVLRYLLSLKQYDNQIFDLQKAALCRETGRIFPDSINWFDMIRVDWDFLQKRYPGDYVSWGSLNDIQQERVRSAHHSLEGFQTEFSSPHSSPRLIEKEYAYKKPGPLYVDVHSNVLLGWKEVPGTNLEVLIVQKPKNKWDVI